MQCQYFRGKLFGYFYLKFLLRTISYYTIWDIIGSKIVLFLNTKKGGVGNAHLKEKKGEGAICCMNKINIDFMVLNITEKEIVKISVFFFMVLNNNMNSNKDYIIQTNIMHLNSSIYKWLRVRLYEIILQKWVYLAFSK